MTIFLTILLVLVAGATLYALARGVIGMAQGKDVTGMQSQQWMRRRVLFQALAIIVILLLLMMAGGKH